MNAGTWLWWDPQSECSEHCECSESSECRYMYKVGSGDQHSELNPHSGRSGRSTSQVTFCVILRKPDILEKSINLPSWQFELSVLPSWVVVCPSGHTMQFVAVSVLL